MNDKQRLREKADRILSDIHESVIREAREATREVIEIEKKDWKAIIERVRRIEDRLYRLSHSPIGQEERK